MKELTTRMAGLRLFELQAFEDGRGFFLESYRNAWSRELGLPDFVQENHSRSRRGVLRGMHFQLAVGQAKLVRTVRGEIFDVAIDLRHSSPTFGAWEGFRLDDHRHHVLYLPIGFAHGFCVTSDYADVTYKVSSPYDASSERTLAWDDPRIGILWPTDEPQLSSRDAVGQSLDELESELWTWTAALGQ